MFLCNTELLRGTKSKREKARSLITKIVNSLTAASEIGGPMASMYLLKHPDHYTSHKFKICFWRGYVYEVMKAWDDSYKIDEEGKSKVMLNWKKNGEHNKEIVAMSPVLDYIWRPAEYGNVSLYDWIRLSEKHRVPQPRKVKKANKMCRWKWTVIVSLKMTTL